MGPLYGLVFGSGLCALVYQTIWLRELRLVFGASTAASAAVVAIFMGGLGFGSLVLGKYADRSREPLRFYAHLELIVALGASTSPLLLSLVRRTYVMLGGSVSLGPGLAALVRLALAGLVLALPTLAMGGTLPAAGRAVTSPGDSGRRRVALLYGVNTLGAVLAVLLCTFYLLERLGAVKTLLAASGLNVVIALAAWLLARRADLYETPGGAPTPPSARSEEGDAHEPAPASWVVTAAGVAGFAFFLMEIVWYRLLSPLLGGTTFMFGSILAVALLGVGLGGALFGIVGRRREATLARLARTCALEAFCLIVPFAIGDRIAIATALAQARRALAFGELVALWLVVTAVVVWPAALVAGYQFPLLIALLGRGVRHVGRHTGLAYAGNTAGAMAGALAGGFGLLPLLTAPGAWRFAVLLLVLLGAVILGLALRRERRRRHLPISIILLALATLMLAAAGPTPLWRHGSIGAARFPDLTTSNEVREWVRSTRAAVRWEAEGVESSLAVIDDEALAFMLNGKTDGNTKEDAGTQVMMGLVGALFHPGPARALVVGLGTGSTAGWLAALPTMGRVDVVELEPAIADFARQCNPVNHGALGNARVHVLFGDGREWLLTTREHYDIIASEPSNPYRAGIASLYTVEYYEAAARCLAGGGIFLQWLQGYEVDFETVATVVATVSAVFPAVELWQTMSSDLLLVGARAELAWNVPALRRRIAEEPFRSALFGAWRVTDLEGVLARFVGNTVFTREVAACAPGGVNTDDRTLVEYAYARTLGRRGLFTLRTLREEAEAAGVQWPHLVAATVADAVDWESVAEQRELIAAFEEDQNWTALLGEWDSPLRPPRHFLEFVAAAEVMADQGDYQARSLIDRVRERQPTEADLLHGRLLFRQDRIEEAVTAFARGFGRLRVDPWPVAPLVRRALDLLPRLLAVEPGLAPALLEMVAEPFCVYSAEGRRQETAALIAGYVSDNAALEALARLEPHFPMSSTLLDRRAQLYERTQHARRREAALDLQAFQGGTTGRSHAEVVLLRVPDPSRWWDRVVVKLCGG
ncbi:MAG: fused MFS/spermidine synthase [Planctomycetota bacterium]